MSELSRDVVRVIICCKSNKTSPIANSTAEKIKKKNVKDNILRLSKIKPTSSARAYKVIHKSSAVNKRCKVVFVWIINVENIKKKKSIKVFISPKNKIIFLLKFYRIINTLV